MRVVVLGTIISAICLISASQVQIDATRQCKWRPPGDQSLVNQQVLSLDTDSFMRDPAECLAKGKVIWDQISTTKADAPRTQTTDKFVASYASLFTHESMTTKPNKEDSDAGNQIMSALNRKTVNGDPLAKPLMPNLPGDLGDSIMSDSCAYELAFAPGLIVAVISFKVSDPVPKDKQVNWDVIAMELYKKYRGAASPTDLKYILRFHIVNIDTKAVLEKLYTDNGMKSQITAKDSEWVKWDPKSKLEAVQMMLGTDNGSGAGYMLIDYKSTLEKSGIAAIHTRRSGGEWAMATEFA